MGTKVTDPALLAELEGAPTKVVDPAILAELEGAQPEGEDVATRALKTPEAAAIASGAEAIPFGQKIAALLSAGVLKGYKGLSSEPAYQNMDTSYEGALKRIRGSADKASKESPWISGAAKLAGGAASIAALPGSGVKVAQNAGAVARAVPGAIQALRYGALHGIGNKDTPTEQLEAGAEGGAVNGAVGLGLGAVLNAAAPIARRLAGNLKVSSLRPTPLMAEEMADLPGGKSEVGQTLLRENVGAPTAEGQKKQIADAMGRAMGRVDNAASAAEAFRPPDASPNVWSASSSPDDIDAVAETLMRDVRGSTNPQPLLRSTGETSLSRAPRAGAASEGTEVVPLPRPMPKVTANSLSRRLLDQATEETASPLQNSWREGVRNTGDQLTNDLESLKSARSGDRTVQDAVDLYRDMYKNAYEVQDPAAFSYRKGLQGAAGVVRGGVGEHIRSVAPDLASEFEGGNLDYRRLLAAKDANERYAARLSKNHTFGLHDLMAAGAAGMHSPAEAIPALLASKLATRYGPQAAARALWALGGEAAPRVATSLAAPESEGIAALLKALTEKTQIAPMSAAAEEGK